MPALDLADPTDRAAAPVLDPVLDPVLVLDAGPVAAPVAAPTPVAAGPVGGASDVPPVVPPTPAPSVALPVAATTVAAVMPPPSHRFFGLLPAEFDQVAAGLGWPRYRTQQVRDWVYAKAVGSADGMTNLPKRDRDTLGRSVAFARATVARRQDSVDGTRKLLLEWADADGVAGKVANAETVMIPDGDRRTACVSSQVGCPVGCKFCASGLAGAKGNLTADQIVEQLFQLNQLLKPAGERVTNVVFMGMGEPLANYANVMKAVRVLHDPGCYNIGARKITISTVGVPAKMRELADEELPLNLAISLHAPNEPLRRQLIPWAEHFALPDILDAARYYFDQTGREVTLEYILLAGVNDRVEHARQLAKLCRSLRANVNLIRYNEVEGLPYGRPLAADVLAFQDVLRASGANAHVRKSRGRDIDAACGQLRRKQAQQTGDGGVATQDVRRLVPLGRT